ncbi:uncharacterized protein [Watersipora subatra]|uniref:uncharacterized protein n=1 Tax=Watersipora subatra TaxID=2589382 RepID=UPI00355C0855
MADVEDDYFLSIELQSKKAMNIFKDMDNVLLTTPSYNGRLATVLTVPPRLRSDEHIRTIKALLRGHAAFEDYPDHVKDQLCQAMIYQRYEARRVITRLGHEARIFYLLLSGTLLVNIKERSEQNGQEFMRTVNQLTGGEAFGEVGLITGSKRNATIICKTDTELLLIEKEDFDKIIRNPLAKQRTGHVEYIKEMELFKYFPCEVLVDDSQDFFYQYFKPNTLILSDSVDSDYLVVVISGKCKAVVAYDAEQRQNKNKRKTELGKQLEAKFPLYSQKLRREQTDNLRRDVSALENTAALEFDLKAKGGVKINMNVERFNKEYPPTGRAKGPIKRRRSNSLTGFFDLMETKRKQSGELNTSFWSEALSEKKPKSVTMPPIEEQKGSSEAKSKKTPKRKWTPYVQEQPKVTQGGVRTWKRVAAMLGAQKSAEAKARAAAMTRFAQLAEFNEGKVFGLETLLHKDASLPIGLVSEGAECLFISKKIFLEHANSKVLRVVSDLVVTYPSQEFIGTYIQRQKKWKEYKALLIKRHARNINSASIN